MKKVKIMLTSIALLAVVGGAVAFKANYIFPYCTTGTVAGPNGPICDPLRTTCPVIEATTLGGTSTVCYFTPPVFRDCLTEECTLTTKTVID